MTFVPIALIRRRAIIRKFLNNGAISPETAKTPEEVGSFKAFGFMYSRLESCGFIKSCGDNRYYVDAEKASIDPRRARSVFVIFLGTMIAVACTIASASHEVSLGIIIPGLVVAVFLIALGVFLTRRK